MKTPDASSKNQCIRVRSFLSASANTMTFWQREIPAHLKFTVSGFSPTRMVYVLCLLMLALVPLHNRLPCQASVVLGGFAGLLTLVIGGLCWCIPQTAPGWWIPRVLGLIGFLMHLGSIH